MFLFICWIKTCSRFASDPISDWAFFCSVFLVQCSSLQFRFAMEQPNILSFKGQLLSFGKLKENNSPKIAKMRFYQKTSQCRCKKEQCWGIRHVICRMLWAEQRCLEWRMRGKIKRDLLYLLLSLLIGCISQAHHRKRTAQQEVNVLLDVNMPVMWWVRHCQTMAEYRGWVSASVERRNFARWLHHSWPFVPPDVDGVQTKTLTLDEFRVMM